MLDHFRSYRAAYSISGRSAQKQNRAAPAENYSRRLVERRVGRESSNSRSLVTGPLLMTAAKRCRRPQVVGQPAGGLAEKARSIYGSRHEEFLDNVKAFAYFPYAVAKDIDDFHDGEISIRFKMIAGQLDRCEGILFNLKPNGDYLTVRFNGMEDNVVLWTFNKGTRKFVKRGTENMPLVLNQWHTLQVSIHGTNLQASLNGKHLLDTR